MSFDGFLLSLIAISLVVILLGMPVAFALGACAVAYLLYEGFPLTQAAQELAFSIDKFSMLAIPLFMLAGQLMNAAKITDRIFDFAMALVGRIPGGLGHVNVVCSLVFAGMSGSALADVASLGSMQVNAMKKHGYDEKFSVGITLASSAIGPILPPSIPLVMFGIIAQVSITQLFLGGVVPAFVIAVCLMGYVFFVGCRRGYVSTERVTSKALAIAFLKAAPPMLTPVIIVGGMTLGIFSPTEGATVAVLYALVLGGLVYRDLTIRAIGETLASVTAASTKLLFIIANAVLFGWVLTIGNVPQTTAEAIATTFDSPAMFILLTLVALLILGAIIENAILLLILAPMLVQVGGAQYGLDPIHLGVVMVFAIMIGQYTPPLGLSLFLMRDLTGMSFRRVSLSVAPFLIPLIVALLIMAYVPSIVTALPHALGY
ncbi:TRAP transporter, DctM subunit [Fulvimarina manganoxydans]|uniref:TRAP transporter large permease protein n=1 Tax=Fulvimarina manganoxydans TaxID=937218 RepID=A0A1W1ZDC0_9HYPH|nr:TRAP transporter large permease [Fulvimarina manganoxydans]MCK5932738.1 TRAP transporter large permease [Fulvimarina manganoxydans]MEE2950460.1 TRAP transporter large permease [Pseudomonadota bacterium]SMC46440.1 TRAP transporter, DctM subunit [Fulvimarina manganoxydans]